MEELLVPLCMVIAVSGDVYLNPDNGEMYKTSKKQTVLRKVDNNYNKPLNRVVVKDKSSLIKGYYEKQ